jgi:hypothetical protein
VRLVRANHGELWHDAHQQRGRPLNGMLQGRLTMTFDAYLESLRIKKRPTKTISGKTYELNLFTGFCKRSYIFGFHPKTNLSRKANPWTKRQPSFRLPRFRGERSEESLLEGLHEGDHVFNLVVVNHVLERRHQ